MSAGRPRKAPQLKVLEGSFRKDRDDHGAAQSKPVGLPPCPVWLPRTAKKYWKEIGPQLANAGLMSLLDTAAFAAHCDSMGKFEEVTRKLKTLDDMMDTTPNGLQIQSALFTIRNKLWDQVLKSASEFGLTPAAASRVKAPEQKQMSLGGFEDL
ncbi:phage terminase small subunit P27 family [Microbulbifer sp. HZ11]|uniref:phage terminase small subunit P27 family n=1 Tax=Microbulbifer sp. HZ11 TaxID=1453501 RepID=UPI0005BC490A|nr:phage terminase small subunit P27 family [Microbulbifer sp. HZ11]